MVKFVRVIVLVRVEQQVFDKNETQINRKYNVKRRPENARYWVMGCRRSYGYPNITVGGSCLLLCNQNTLPSSLFVCIVDSVPHLFVGFSLLWREIIGNPRLKLEFFFSSFQLV